MSQGSSLQPLLLANLLLTCACLIVLSIVLLSGFQDNCGYDTVNDTPDNVDKVCGFVEHPIDYDDGPGKLLWLGHLLRHGERSPLFFVSDDVYKDYDWPDGPEMLTDRGREHLYCLGAMMRKRYSAYLEQVNHLNIHAKTSPVRRCVESNQQVLAGMFPPKHRWSKLNIGKYWKGVDVQMSEQTRSWLLYYFPQCPKAEQIRANWTNNPHLSSDDASFYRKLQNITNREVKSMIDAVLFADTVLAEKTIFEDSFQMLSWLPSIVNGRDPIDAMKRFKKNFFTRFANNSEYLRLVSGYLLNDVHLEASKALANPKIKQMNTYSTHDLFMSEFLLSLELFDDIPSYGSGIIFELREIRPDTRVMRMLYLNTTNHYSVREMPIHESRIFKGGCTSPVCNFDDFFQQLNSSRLLISDIQGECRL